MLRSTGPNVSWIVSLYAIACLIRFAFVFFFGNHSPQIADAVDYDGLAVRILETGSYIGADGALSSQRPPLYPALVAGIFYFFGPHNYVAVAAIQSIFSLATMAITHAVGSFLGGRWVGFVSASIVGLYPTLLAFNCLLLSETLFTFFVISGVFCSLKFLERPNYRWAILLGFCFGLGSLTRSILYVCAVPTIAYLLCFSADSLKHRLISCAVCAVTLIAILAPWSYRNTKLQKTFTVVDVMGGRNVMMGNYEFTPLDRSWATITDVSGPKAWHQVLLSEVNSNEPLTQGQIDKLAMSRGIRYFFSHPLVSAKRVLVRFFNFWQLERSIPAGLRKGIWGTTSREFFIACSVIVVGAYSVLLFLCLQGMVHSPPSIARTSLLILWMGLPCAIHTAAFAHSRYHLPLVPIMACYAALFLIGTKRGSKTGGVNPRRLSTFACVLFGIFVCAWLRELIVVDLGSTF